MPGLDAVHGGVAPQQQVAVGLGDRADREFLDLVVGVGLGIVADQCLAQAGQVVRGGVVVRCRQPVRVDEVGRGHADALGVAVHQRGEGFLAAGSVLGQSDGGIVARLHRHAHFHVVQARGLVDRETAVTAVGARPTLAPGALAQHHLVVGRDLAVLLFGGHHVAGHHLGDAGRFHALVVVLPGQHLAGGVVHQDPGGADRLGRRRDLHRCARLGGRRGSLWRRCLGEGQAHGNGGHGGQGET